MANDKPVAPAGKGARTSVSHPLQIAAVSAGSGFGRVGITFCPGKQQAHDRGCRCAFRARGNGMSRNAASALPAAAESDSASRWQTLFGSEPPPRLPSIVAQAVAWREQMLIHGDVSATIAHDLKLAAEHALARRGVSQAVEPDQTLEEIPVAPPTGRGSVTRKAPLPPAASQLLPGSQLIKAYAGRNHIVTVEAEGFRYEGQSFTSLSAVAKHITGTHWNGLLFFGLRKRRSYAPKPRRHG